MEVPQTRPQPVYPGYPPPGYQQGHARAPQSAPGQPPASWPPPQHQAPRRRWTTRRKLLTGGAAVIVAGAAAIGLSQHSASAVSAWYAKGYKAGQSLTSQVTASYGVDNLTSNAQCVQYWNENMPGSGGVPDGTPGERYSDGWIAACEGAPYGQPGSPASLPPGP